MSNTPPTVALFDLDHTLLPIDSDHAWGHFLVEKGVVDQLTYQKANNYFYQAYKDGTLNIDEFLQFALKPLADHPKEILHAWHAEFMTTTIEPAIQQSALDLVQSHLDKHHLCCIVTATNTFVTAPIAKRFGIDHLLGTIPEENAQGEFTGRVKGKPNFQAGKIEHVTSWLATMGFDINALPHTIFYSDSMNDLPLLEKVTEPVATNPDARLLAIATEKSWKVLHLFS
jgi:HAD superfamily hydrolase (TIGR01490 family)